MATRAEHYLIAEKLLNNLMKNAHKFTNEDVMVVTATAQVHAALASVETPVEFAAIRAINEV